MVSVTLSVMLKEERDPERERGGKWKLVLVLVLV
jgi:hypothetical protein